MSDTSNGSGWWLASDGKWYPPEQATHLATPALPTIPAPTLGRSSATLTAPPQQITHTFQPPAGYKLKKKRRWPWVLLAVIVLFVIGAAINGTAEEEPGEQPDASNSQPAAAAADSSAEAPAADSSGPLTVGSTDNTSGFDVTLLQVVDPWTSTNQFESPDAGNRFLAVELNMVNTTDEIRPFSTLLGLEIIDSLGQRWNPAFAGFDLPQLGGDVAPGENIRGWQVFEVPADATGLRLKVLGSLTASGIKFQL
jgi:hypothetical protein